MNNITDRYKKLTLLHSNDMHGDFLAENVNNDLVGGVSMLSGYISKVKAEEENVLYCVAGDMFRGSVIDSEYQGVSTIEIMNMLAPDVVTIGNHETDYGLSHLLFIEKCAKFPIINSNLYIKMNGTRLFKPYHLVEIGGMKVLFIGILTEDVIATTRTEGIVGTLVDVNDAAEEVEKICNTFKGIDIDFTVLLTHIGFDKDKELAAKLSPELGVDVIIGGHSHTYIDEPAKVNDIYIVQAGTGTDQIGRFDILVDTDTNSVASYKWEAVPINEATCPKDAKMEKLIAGLKSETDLKYGRVVRRLKCELSHPTRKAITELGCFVSDLFKLALGCDWFTLTSGAVRVKALGPIITLQDLTEAYPFNKKVYEVRLTGEQIKRVFKYIYRKEAYDIDKDEEFYQLSCGWKVIINRHDDSIDVSYNNVKVDDKRIFSVCMSSYDYESFERFFGIPLDEVKHNFMPKIISGSATELLYEYLENCEQLPGYPDNKGRLTIIE